MKFKASATVVVQATDATGAQMPPEERSVAHEAEIPDSPEPYDKAVAVHQAFGRLLSVAAVGNIKALTVSLE